MDKLEKDGITAPSNDGKHGISVFSSAGSCLQTTNSVSKSVEKNDFNIVINEKNETVEGDDDSSNTACARTVHLLIPYDGIVTLKNRKNCKKKSESADKSGVSGVSVSGVGMTTEDCDDVEIVDIDKDKDKESNREEEDDSNSNSDSNSLWVPLTALSVQRSAYVPQHLQTQITFDLQEGEVENDNYKVKTFYWNRFSQKIQVTQIEKEICILLFLLRL